MALSVHIEKNLTNYTLKMDFETDNQVLALLGASGSGKSMTLKCIAGIETPDSGRIELNGRVLFDSEKRINLPPQKRRVGYLFQQYALFPQMTVEQNIRCGIRKKETADEVIGDIIHKMRLEGLEKKLPAELSGGEQQRTALARILVNEPEVLLLDEPFSALDTHLRFQLENEIRKLLSEFHQPVILVSHNRDEVFRMSDRIATMHQGRIEKLGSRDEVFTNPETISGAVLTGCKNLYACVARDRNHVFVPELNCVLETARDAEQAKFIGIRMHDVVIGAEQNGICGRLVEEVENPFSYVAAFQIGDKAVIRLETDKKEWKEKRSEHLKLSLPAEKLLLLRE